MSANEIIKVLILDDEKSIREGLEFFIKTISGLIPVVASMPSEAYKIVKNEHKP